MAQVLVSITELLVGLACVGLALSVWRRGGWVRAGAVALVVAGLAAARNAVVALKRPGFPEGSDP